MSAMSSVNDLALVKPISDIATFGLIIILFQYAYWKRIQ